MMPPFASSMFWPSAAFSQGQFPANFLFPILFIFFSLLTTSIFGFDAASNEMPFDPNNGIKSAFTNEPPVRVRPMPHQPSESEKMPYEFWQQNRPFAHVHGTEPENVEHRHQHFGRNYYENFDNFITDPPGTGLNVRSIDDQFGATKSPRIIVPSSPQQFPLMTAPFPPSSLNLEQITAGEQGEKPLNLPAPTRVLPSIPSNPSELAIDPLAAAGRIGASATGGAQSLSARFPNSFKPNLAKLINEVDPNSSAAAAKEDDDEEEESVGEREIIPKGALAGEQKRPPNEFDAYEDLPDFKAGGLLLTPRKPSKPPLVPLKNLLPQKVVPAIRPPKLVPFNARGNGRGGNSKLTIRKKLGRIVVSREQKLPDNLAKTEGHPSAIVVEGTARPAGGRVKTGESYVQQRPQSSPATYKGSPPPQYGQPPPGYKTANPIGQNYPTAGQQYALPVGKPNGCQCPSGSPQNCCCRPSNGGCGRPSNNCCGGGGGGGGGSNCGAPCCCGGNNGGCCCQGAGGGSQAACRIRLIISCPPEPCARRLLRTAHTRVLFAAHRRRRRRVKFDGIGGQMRQSRNPMLGIWRRR